MVFLSSIVTSDVFIGKRTFCSWLQRITHNGAKAFAPHCRRKWYFSFHGHRVVKLRFLFYSDFVMRLNGIFTEQLKTGFSLQFPSFCDSKMSVLPTDRIAMGITHVVAKLYRALEKYYFKMGKTHHVSWSWVCMCVVTGGWQGNVMMIMLLNSVIGNTWLL